MIFKKDVSKCTIFEIFYSKTFDKTHSDIVYGTLKQCVIEDYLKQQCSGISYAGNLEKGYCKVKKGQMTGSMSWNQIAITIDLK